MTHWSEERVNLKTVDSDLRVYLMQIHCVYVHLTIQITVYLVVSGLFLPQKLRSETATMHYQGTAVMEMLKRLSIKCIWIAAVCW